MSSALSTAHLSDTDWSKNSTDPYKKIVFRTCKELFDKIHLPSALAKLIQTATTPHQLLDALLLKNELDYSVYVLTHALPGREALLWCCLSIEKEMGSKMKPEERMLFEKCVRWVMLVEPEAREAIGVPEETLKEVATYYLSKAIAAGGTQIEAEHKKQLARQTKSDSNPPQQESQILRFDSTFHQLLRHCLQVLSFAVGWKERFFAQRRIIGIGLGVGRGVYHFAR